MFRSSNYLTLAMLAAVVLLSPTFFMGFFADDYGHQIALRKDYADSPMQAWSLYDFGSYQDWKEHGNPFLNFPWWADQEWKIRFLRPVSSIILWLQYQVFGSQAWGYHLTSLLMYLALLFSIHRLYGQLGMNKHAAGRGILLFALYQGSVMPAAWPANQNSLVVGLMAVTAIRLLLSRPIRPFLLGAALVFAGLAAFAKESGSATLVLAGIVLLFRIRNRETTPSNIEKRLAKWGVAIAIAIFAIWAATIVSGGYGTSSVFYATPWRDPLRFFMRAIALYTAGIASFFGPFPLDLLGVYANAYVPVVIGGLLISVPLLRWIWRRIPKNNTTKFLAIWFVLFAALQAGAPPTTRVLFVPAIGFCGILGIFFDTLWQRCSSGLLGRRETRAFTVFWWVVVIGGAFAILVQASVLRNMATYCREKVHAMDTGDSAIGHRSVIMLQSESQMEAFALQSVFGFYAPDWNATLYNLQSGPRSLRWTRVSENVFDLESTSHSFLTGQFEQVFLAHPPAFEVGHQWKLDLFQVEALAIEKGEPTKLRFTFDRSIDDPSLVFVRTSERAYKRMVPPRIGASTELPTPELVGPPMP